MLTKLETVPIDASPYDLQGLRVLVVEDRFVIADALRSLFEGAGMVVVGPVATAAAAEQLLTERVPHVALIDLHLQGGETGHHLVDRLSDAGVPVVAISGSSRLPPPSPMLATLRKPFSGSEVLAVVCQLLTAAPLLL